MSRRTRLARHSHRAGPAAHQTALFGLGLLTLLSACDSDSVGETMPSNSDSAASDDDDDDDDDNDDSGDDDDDGSNDDDDATASDQTPEHSNRFEHTSDDQTDSNTDETTTDIDWADALEKAFPADRVIHLKLSFADGDLTKMIEAWNDSQEKIAVPANLHATAVDGTFLQCHGGCSIRNVLCFSFA